MSATLGTVFAVSVGVAVGFWAQAAASQLADERAEADRLTRAEAAAGARDEAAHQLVETADRLLSELDRVDPALCKSPSATRFSSSKFGSCQGVLDPARLETSKQPRLPRSADNEPFSAGVDSAGWSDELFLRYVDEVELFVDEVDGRVTYVRELCTFDARLMCSTSTTSTTTTTTSPPRRSAPSNSSDNRTETPLPPFDFGVTQNAQPRVLVSTYSYCRGTGLVSSWTGEQQVCSVVGVYSDGSESTIRTWWP